VIVWMGVRSAKRSSCLVSIISLSVSFMTDGEGGREEGELYL